MIAAGGAQYSQGFIHQPVPISAYFASWGLGGRELWGGGPNQPFLTRPLVQALKADFGLPPSFPSRTTGDNSIGYRRPKLHFGFEVLDLALGACHLDQPCSSFHWLEGWRG